MSTLSRDAAVFQLHSFSQASGTDLTKVAKAYAFDMTEDHRQHAAFAEAVAGDIEDALSESKSASRGAAAKQVAKNVADKAKKVVTKARGAASEVVDEAGEALGKGRKAVAEAGTKARTAVKEKARKGVAAVKEKATNLKEEVQTHPKIQGPKDRLKRKATTLKEEIQTNPTIQGAKDKAKEHRGLLGFLAGTGTGYAGNDLVESLDEKNAAFIAAAVEFETELEKLAADEREVISDAVFSALAVLTGNLEDGDEKSATAAPAAAATAAKAVGAVAQRGLTFGNKAKAFFGSMFGMKADKNFAKGLLPERLKTLKDISRDDLKAYNAANRSGIRSLRQLASIRRFGKDMRLPVAGGVAVGGGGAYALGSAGGASESDMQQLFENAYSQGADSIRSKGVIGRMFS